MAINYINIVQDNKVGDSNLLPIHSPLSFLIDVEYSGEYPTELYVDIISNSNVIGSYKAIPFKDVLGNVRRFIFVATDVLKGIMADFDDMFQVLNSLVPLGKITRLITVKFYDPDNISMADEVEVNLIHGVSQFGEEPNLVDVFNNIPQTYYGAKGSFVYVYFYNDDINNIITVNNPNVLTEFAQDFDDEIFTDYDDTNFRIDVNFNS